MILVDTSVWIDWLLDHDTLAAQTLDSLLDEPGAIVLCDRIVQEVVQGIRDDAEAREVERRLRVFECLDTGGVALALASAELYRKLRKKGITIRSSNDVVIAALCIQHSLALLHNDRDFDLLAKHTALRTVRYDVHRRKFESVCMLREK